MKKIVVLFLCLIFCFSCGKVINSEHLQGTVLQAQNLLKIDRQCLESPNQMENITKDIFDFYQRLSLKNPVLFLDLTVERFTQDTPLIVGLEQLEAEFIELKSYVGYDNYLPMAEKEIASKFKSLYLKAQRFEGQKCFLSTLKRNQKSDLRPYWDMEKFCVEKSGNEGCQYLAINHLDEIEKVSLYDQIITLCYAFEKKMPHCQAQLQLSTKKGDLNQLISHYLILFKEKKLNPLFQLRKDHKKFQCQKNGNEIIMNIKVSKLNWNENELRELLDYVSAIWSSKKLKVNFSIVLEQNSSTVQIFHVDGLISYVPIEETNKIFLSRSLISDSRQRILAHEFGHVLGFPDCYVEYFEPKTEQLIYYEVKTETKNLMCTIEDDMVVPVSYEQQLLEKSCIF